jgi:hypothetical protein
VIAISSLTAPKSAEEIAARPGLAWERTLPVRTGLTDDSRIEPTLGRIASRIAGHRVQVTAGPRTTGRFLAHEAEHLYDPKASEARVECLAMQHVREIVTLATDLRHRPARQPGSLIPRERRRSSLAA